MNLKNKKVWITGASSGIGEHIAYAYAKRGAYLILSGRNMAELERVKGGCPAAAGVETLFLDLENHAEIFTISEKLLSRIQYVDILVNNAGISQRSLAKDTAFEVDKRLVNIDLLGTIALSKAVLGPMIERKSGQFIVVTSLVGKFGSPLRSAYAAAKHGLHGFFDSLRAELHQDNIKVLMVCPGFVQTNVSRNALTADGSKQGSMDDATSKGLPPSLVAEKLLRAAQAGREEVYIAGFEKFGVYLKRFFPKVFSWYLRRAKVT